MAIELASLHTADALLSALPFLLVKLIFHVPAKASFNRSPRNAKMEDFCIVMWKRKGKYKQKNVIQIHKRGEKNRVARGRDTSRMRVYGSQCLLVGISQPHGPLKNFKIYSPMHISISPCAHFFYMCGDAIKGQAILFLVGFWINYLKRPRVRSLLRYF